ncbi:FAD-binding domain-containing protein [Colletotrichum sublineola]|nr:FAD-binding domain-containing protein [Colletotrichum sublineola]
MGLVSPRPKLSASCKNIPGDAAWPTKHAWDRLNATVDGRLIATTPIAHVCHVPTYSHEACEDLCRRWNTANTMTSLPAEIMSPWFQNQSCVPFTNQSTSCGLGNYASYSINISSVQDIMAGLAFAKKKNVRLVIKNSGHDFFGKSTGKGALSLWTHNLNSMQVIVDYDTSYYQGPAIKIGAGVRGGQAAKFAAQNGYRIVVGSCPTVGAAGGYSQGGGHSFLSGVYGFGADNVLEWEVVTVSGEHVVATPEQNVDLYWALSGGGGGTYGVVVSMTSRVFPDGEISTASLSFGLGQFEGPDEYWAAVEDFIAQLQPLVDNHGIVGELVMTNETLSLFGLMAPGLTSQELQVLLSPVLSALGQTQANLTAETISLSVSNGGGYYELFVATIEPLTETNVLSPAIGGRFVSRETIANNASAVTAAIRAATDGGRFFVAATALNAGGKSRVAAPVADNAVQPALKDAFLSLIITAVWSWDRPWAEAEGLLSELTNVVMPVLEAATPGAGAYANEANWQQPEWQGVFYGDNYERLQSIKATYDPQGLLYGRTAVGSEAWAEDAEGRLCRTK